MDQENIKMNKSLSNNQDEENELNEEDSSSYENHNMLNDETDEMLGNDFFSDELMLEERHLLEERQKEDENTSVKNFDEKERKERYQNLLALLENSTKLTEIFETRLKNCKLQIVKKELEKTNKMKNNVSSNDVNPTDISNEDLEKEKYYLNLFQQPKLFVGKLKTHQIEGLLWIRTLFENGINGILADDMGLGKTIQSIAFYCFLIEMGIPGPFLVIAPLSTIPNWLSEFAKFSPQLSTLLYHGSEKDRIKMRLQLNQTYKVNNVIENCFKIVITTYEVMRYDLKYLKSIKWRFIIIDEGRCLRQFSFSNKLILTGTPIQNNMTELWSLLNLLMPKLFANVDDFNSWFIIDDRFNSNDKIANMAKKDDILHILLKILKPFILRREKKDTDLHLPPKKEIVIYAPITDKQQQLYKATLNKQMDILLNQKKDNDNVIHGVTPKRKCVTNIKRYTDTVAIKRVPKQQKIEEKNMAISVVMQNPLMQLKKIANHPYLVHLPLIPGTKEVLVDENIIKVSGKFQVMDAMLAKLKLLGHKVLLFSTMTQILNVIEDFLIYREYEYTRLDGLMVLQSRVDAMKKFNVEQDCFLMLLSTRAGGLGLNLTSADTVIIFDSDWNPQCDLQAQDRCHRMGQEKPVVVYRFCSKNTVDESILESAVAKRKLEKMVISNGTFNRSTKLTATSTEELMHLLESSDYNKKIQSNGFIFTDEELDILLDRSDMVESKEASEKNTTRSAEHFKVLQTS